MLPHIVVERGYSTKEVVTCVELCTRYVDTDVDGIFDIPFKSLWCYIHNAHIQAEKVAHVKVSSRSPIFINDLSALAI